MRTMVLLTPDLISKLKESVKALGQRGVMIVTNGFKSTSTFKLP
jgi:hypothetical protein